MISKKWGGGIEIYDAMQAESRASAAPHAFPGPASTLTLGDGRQEHYDLVFGADGVGSVVRDALEREGELRVARYVDDNQRVYKTIPRQGWGCGRWGPAVGWDNGIGVPGFIIGYLLFSNAEFCMCFFEFCMVGSSNEMEQHMYRTFCVLLIRAPMPFLSLWFVSAIFSFTQTFHR